MTVFGTQPQLAGDYVSDDRVGSHVDRPVTSLEYFRVLSVNYVRLWLIRMIMMNMMTNE